MTLEDLEMLRSASDNLINTSLQYTHPMFENQHPDWSMVCGIGEEIMKLVDKYSKENE